MTEAMDALLKYLKAEGGDVAELLGLADTLKSAMKAFMADAVNLNKDWEKTARKNNELLAAANDFAPLAEHCRMLSKEIDHAYKLAVRAQEVLVKSGVKGGTSKKLMSALDTTRVRSTLASPL